MGITIPSSFPQRHVIGPKIPPKSIFSPLDFPQILSGFSCDLQDIPFQGLASTTFSAEMGSQDGTQPGRGRHAPRLPSLELFWGGLNSVLDAGGAYDTEQGDE